MKNLLILTLIGFLFFVPNFAAAQETTAWESYISPLKDYSIQHPKEWTALPMGKLYVTFNSPTTNKMKQAIKTSATPKKHVWDDISIAYYETGDGFAGYPKFEQWVMDKANPNSSISNVAEIEFAEIKAFEMIMTGGNTGYMIMVEHNGHLYQIGFNNRSSKAALNETDQKIIKSFRFID